MKKISMLLAFVLFIGGNFLFAQEKTNSGNYIPVTKFDAARNSQKDLEEAVKEAKKSNRKILLDVGGDWCRWCKALDKFFEDNRDVANYMHKHYVVVKVNYSKENKNEKFLSQFPQVAGFPHLFVLNKNGKLIHSQDTGELESGDHHDKDKVFAFLKKWSRK